MLVQDDQHNVFEMGISRGFYIYKIVARTDLGTMKSLINRVRRVAQRRSGVFEEGFLAYLRIVLNIPFGRRYVLGIDREIYYGAYCDHSYWNSWVGVIDHRLCPYRAS
jgi:hypothetical protein